VRQNEWSRDAAVVSRYSHIATSYDHDMFQIWASWPNCYLLPLFAMLYDA